MYRLLISFFAVFIFIFPAFAGEKTFVSISPSLTEVMYAIGAGNNLKAVSTQCSYPREAQDKAIIGDSYFINEELLLKLKPDYFLAPDSAEFLINKYKKYGIAPLCLKYPNIDAIYENILLLGKLTGKEINAQKVVKDIQNKITKARKDNKSPKKIMYVVSMQPFMTIGGKSFITDIIEQSGNHSITKNIDTYYPAISLEYAINQNPDIIVLDYYCFSNGKIEKLFPKAKIITMTKADSDIIDRPATRIYKSVEFFAKISNY